MLLYQIQSKKYIQNQELEDRIEDKKNIKEYQDPF